MKTIASWLWLVSAFLKPITWNTIESIYTKKIPRTEREVPVEVTETTPIPLTTGTVALSGFVEFHEQRQALRHKIGLDFNQTLPQEMDSGFNMTSTTLVPVRIIHNFDRTDYILNFLYLWIVMMVVCIGILGSIALYKNFPRYSKKIQGFIMHHKGPLTKGKDVKQDLKSAV